MSTSSPRRRRILTVLLLLLVIWIFGAWLAAEKLVVRSELWDADAIVVMGGSAVYRERTRHAAELYEQGRAPIVILTNDNVRGGYSLTQERNVLFVERAREELTRSGVPADHIEVLPQVVASTRDEASALRDFATTRKLQSLLVVTSGYHSRRTRWTLGKAFAGTEVRIGIDPVAPGNETPSPLTWWFYPSGWRMVAGEYVKIVYYWFVAR